MKKFLLYGVLLLLLSQYGCYTPPPLGSLVEERSFTARPMDGAQSPFRDKKVLTLKEAMEYSATNNPTYQSAFYAITSAKMYYFQAIGAYSPTIDAAVAVGGQLYGGGASMYGQNISGHVGYTFTTVGASWVLFNGLAREFNLLASKEGVKMQEHLAENAARLLIEAISIAYFEVNRTVAQRNIAQADVDFQRDQFQQAEKKWRAGEISRSDVLNFAGNLRQAERNVLQSDNRYQLSLYALAVLMGYPEGALSPELTFEMPAFDYQTIMPAVDVYLDCALNNRPDLNAFREKLVMMKYQLYQTYSVFMPTISAFANYSYSSNSTYNAGNNPTGFSNFYQPGSSFNYGGMANLNLFSGFQNYNRSRQARALLDQAYLQGAGDWQSVVQSVRSAYSTLQHNLELVKLCRETRDIMLEQRDLVLKEYQVGEVDILRLNNAQQNYIVSENEFSEALVNAQNASTQLHSAAATDFRLLEELTSEKAALIASPSFL